MSARHLRLVPSDGQTPAQAAYTAVQLLTQRYALELLDALADLATAHDDPVAVAQDLQQLRQETMRGTSVVFSSVGKHLQRRWGAQ